MEVVNAEKPKEGETAPPVINDPRIEEQWLMAAVQHAETYYKILTSVKDTKALKLTKWDDEIYESFRKEFPDLKVDVISEDELKSDEGKQKWRPFMMNFEKKVDSFNFLTMLRLDCKGDYTEANTTLVPRIQFYCIELARLREGHNQQLQSNN